MGRISENAQQLLGANLEIDDYIHTNMFGLVAGRVFQVHETVAGYRMSSGSVASALWRC